MSKLGVGVGDEFPIDEGGQRGSAAPDPDYEKQREEWLKRREEWLKHRAEWRERRRQWREEWRNRRNAFHDEMRERQSDARDCAHDHFYDHGHWHFDSHYFLPIIATLGFIVLAIVVFSHIYILFGLIVLAGLYFAYRGGFDHFDILQPGRRQDSPPPADAPKA